MHGALQAGALSTSFTASQGLFLMIPNMYKISGELLPGVLHVSARSISAQALSIFGDHADVYSVRQSGFAMLASSGVQEIMDLGSIAHLSAIKGRVPFLHFFDGFRTSHEIQKIEVIDCDDLAKLLDWDALAAFRKRALSPENPVTRGTAQNPDIYFQEREASNPYYKAVPGIVEEYMKEISKMTGREYGLFNYYGAKDADRVIIAMGSVCETIMETIDYLNAKGEKVGLVNVHLYRPWSIDHFLKMVPTTVKCIAVLDRTKEPGAAGEPLYLDVRDSYYNRSGAPVIVGGRYGLSSKDTTPAQIIAVYENLTLKEPKNGFTVGITDDVTFTSLPVKDEIDVSPKGTYSAKFFGLGSDGTVGANKNSIKIIGEETANNAQGYFFYDSKKSGQMTVSHLRFGPKSIHATYLIEPNQANFVACHQFSFLERFDMLKYAKPGGVFLLNSLYGPKEVWGKLPREVQQTIIEKKLRFFVIDAYEVAQRTGMGGRINTIMQTCFFAISGVLPREEAIAEIKHAIEKTYGKRGEAVVQANFEAVDQALAYLFEVEVPGQVVGTQTRREPVSSQAPKFVREVLGEIIASEGDRLPVSAFPVDGTFPSGTTQWEKRNIALEIPVWEPDLCIQCGKCCFVCPHAVIREKVYAPSYLENAPQGWQAVEARWKEFPDMKYTLAVAPEDCTGCGLCVEVCPAKDKSQVGRKAINMADQIPIRESEKIKWEYFLTLPEVDRTQMSLRTVKNSQLLQPLFEFSGACAGCGETPYLKLLTQLYGDRIVIANATGCSSIYGGNLPTTPWTKNSQGRGPAWSNSLFEDNAEFGLGMRLTLDKQGEYARELLYQLAAVVGETLVDELLNADQSTELGIQQQRARIATLKEKLKSIDDPHAHDLLSLADVLVRKSVWIIGGDGWAYDIGYGGLDHVLASGRNVNVLVLDTEVYSNTGGQASKSTPRAAVAKFAAQGKGVPKKDLGMIAMAYGYVYVARVAMGAGDQQTLNAFVEADAYDGPSLIIAYSHCINHGYDLRKGLEQQKLAVQCGIWPLYRFNPALIEQGQNPLSIDSKEPTIPVSQYAYNETRYRMLLLSDEQRAEALMKLAQKDAKSRWALYQQMAALHYDTGTDSESKG
jgi:pyruvate-ferredoxin/flavodoxin oxidoreductase